MAMQYYRQTGMRPYTARALEVAAVLHERAGRPDEAERAREEAASMRVPIPRPNELPLAEA
jgi:hypothetical protein